MSENKEKNLIGERYFVSPQAEMQISLYPHGAVGYLGDWTDGEKYFFESICGLIAETLPDGFEPIDIVLALGWEERSKEESELAGIKKCLEANVADGRMRKQKNSAGEDTFILTEAGRIYVDQFLTARAKELG